MSEYHIKFLKGLQTWVEAEGWEINAECIGETIEHIESLTKANEALREENDQIAIEYEINTEQKGS